MTEESDIFLSYARSDADAVARLRQDLEAEGLSIWIDESQIEAFQSITHSIENGFLRSKCFLAFYSKAYPTRRACQWELTSAFLLAQREGDPRRRILVVNPEQTVAHIQPAELRDGKHLTPDAPRLAHSISAHVTGITGRFGDIPRSTAPQWFGLRPVRSSRFAGRLADMWWIHSELNPDNTSAIAGNSPSGIVQVSGFAGVGKSLLVEEYASRFSLGYPAGIFWLSARDTRTSIEAGSFDENEFRRMQVVDIAERIGVRTQQRSLASVEGDLARCLEAMGAPYLWVVDDVPASLDPEHLRRWFAPSPQGRTLLTTRSRLDTGLAAVHEIGALPPDAAFELLTQRRKPDSADDVEAARGLIEDLGYHALAVDLAGAAIAVGAGAFSFRSFRSMILQRHSVLFDVAGTLTGVLPTKQSASMVATLLTIAERLRGDAEPLLGLAALLPPLPIPLNMAIGIVKRLKAVNDEDSRLIVCRCLFEFDQFSACERHSGPFDAYSIHPLLLHAIKASECDHSGADLLKKAAVTYLSETLKAVTWVPTCDGAESDLIATHARALATAVSGDDSIALLSLLALYYSRTGNVAAVGDATRLAALVVRSYSV